MLFRLTRLFRAAGRDIVVLWYACRHPGAPFLLKVAALLLAMYVISPVDLVPDWLALLGWVDDLTLLALVIPMLLAWMPESVLRDARRAAEVFMARKMFWPGK